MSSDYGIELLGQLPLDMRIREQVDSGRPTLVAEPDGDISRIYKSIARKVAAKIAAQKRDYGSAFPKIVVQNN